MGREQRKRPDPEQGAPGTAKILDAFSLTASSQSHFDQILTAFFLPFGLCTL